MPTMRFNHMELTFPKGTLDEKLFEDLERFYGGIFGWTGMKASVVGQSNYLLLVDEGQFILLAESSKPMQAPGYDHLGLLVETRQEVDELLEQCRKFRERDDRVDIMEFDEDLKQGPVTVHAFYVKYLLPIRFDVQALEYDAGAEPRRRWSLA